MLGKSHSSVQIWEAFCRTNDTINIAGDCLNNRFKLVSGDDCLWQWLALNLRPCSIHAVAIVVHLLFLLLWVINFLRRKVDLYRQAHPEISPHELHKPTVHAFKPGIYVTSIIWSCGLLLTIKVVDALWEIVIVRRHGQLELPVHLKVLLAVQIAAWLIMYAAANLAKFEKVAKFSATLRLWWCLSLLLSFLTITSHVIYYVKLSDLPLDAWTDIVSAPIYVFLFVAGVNGQTGIALEVDEPLKEPLLTEAHDKEDPGVTPFADCGLWGTISLSWLNPVLRLGAQKTLELKDLPYLSPKYLASYTYEWFNCNWEKCKSANPSKPPSLLTAVCKSFWRGALFNAFLAGVNSCATYVGPFLIDDFVQYLAGRRRFAYEGYTLVLLFFGAKLVETIAQRQWYVGMQSLGMHFRNALTAFIYKKGLRLSSHARQSHTSGEITNYVTVDVQRIGDFAWYFHDIWVLPLQVILALAILYKVVGLAALAGLATAILTIVINVPLVRMQDTFQDKLMEAKDKRMKALTECLRSMRILKLQTWENKYLSKLESLRYGEYIWLRKGLYTSAVSTFVFWSAPMVVSVMTFGTCVLLNTELTAGRILTALATIRVLQDPLNQIPELMSMIAQTRVSLDRLQKYLQEEELQIGAVKKLEYPSEDALAIAIDGGEFSWNLAAEERTLRNVNLHVRKGQSIAVCGTVGSGKSSLLSCILGEIPRLDGMVEISGRTAYVAQTAWIQSRNIEENILFGKPMDRERYEMALSVCSLDKDIELFSFGDQTVIGERGINMSGGQKQRIQLARAVYQDCDIYLLDDPFSAVDAHTGSALFKECILGALSSKTVIFVTHQIEFLPSADLILVLRNGEIVQQGTYDELLQAGADFQTLVGAHNDAVSFMDASGFRRTEENTDCKEDQLLDSESTKDENMVIHPVAKKNEEEEEITSNTTKRQIIQDEERERGKISFSVYWNYLTAVYKGALIPLIVAFQITFYLFQIGSNYWMAWATPATAGDPQRVDNTTMILVFVVLALGSSLFVSLRAVLVATVGLLTAQKMFMNMLRAIFRAPMAFFDSTPTGRILNRASSDQNTLDSMILYTFSGLMQSVVQLVGIIIVMCQVTWQVLLLFFPVTLICIGMQAYYIKTARELQRLVGILKSPIIHHYSESIAGAATIRGFEQETRFLNTNLSLSDQYSRAIFHNFAAIQWLMFRMELLSNLVFCFSLVYVISTPVGKLDPSLAGLAVTYGLQLNDVQSWFIWCVCNLENRTVSVERIQQYSNIESEAPLVIEASRPSVDWPSQGTIELHDLQVRYTLHTPMVLHGITCTFAGGEKIGVVGRTGSGKSTLIQALFRLVEPAWGKIIIDGVDICSIGLHDLRSKLSIIPQDPTLFEGTMRSNIDPLEEHSDAELWEILDKCQLGDIIRAKDEKLQCLVSENGENWSVGQRQLVCMGRALLKRTQILVLDEATASVDSVTDGILQRTLRSEFGSCTVITVAHRIPTVIDSNKVLVLSDGRVAEYDAPVKLLEERSSLFYKLVSEYSTRSSSASKLKESD